MAYYYENYLSFLLKKIKIKNKKRELENSLIKEFNIIK